MADEMDDLGGLLNDPDLRSTSEAWHALVDQVGACADLAGDADASKMPVTDDYPAALDALRAAAASGVLHEAHTAAQRFQAAVHTDRATAAIAEQRAGINEVALMGSVMMLRGALLRVDEAVARLEARFPAGG